MIGKIINKKLNVSFFTARLLKVSTAESLRLKDVLEDVFKASVVRLEDGVLSAHVQWPLLLNRILETAVSEPSNGLQKKKQVQSELRHVPLYIKPFFFFFFTSSVLYIPIPQPPVVKSYTSHSLGLLPSAGVKIILNLPGWSTTKSVALY